jgi:hypothetical protein
MRSGASLAGAASEILIAMLPKFFASWLVVLILVPFTAPFSTCDLTGFLASAERHHTPLAPRRSTAVTNDAAVPSVPCISTARRVRLLPLSRLAPAQARTASSSARVGWSVASAGCIREHTVLTTILRL